ncbi:carboxylate-amine ligase [Saccharothrix sp. Mg75]|uniref:carboxylate-amine ligase n=1 Tax=Saccharothrix sp. Mg75 TaxID=3445357 RepID=UPI003EEF1297
MDVPQSPPTLGVEEEFLLVDARTGEPAPLGAEVVAATRRRFGVDLDVELARAQVEAKTAVCRSLADVGRQLRGLRLVAAEAARDLGCRLLATGVPPVGGPEVRTSGGDRYRHLVEDYRLMAREQSICGCHVHVAVPDRETAVQVCNHLRPWLPVLGTVTANSPFAGGRDTGYESWRTVVWSRWPAAGPPPYFESAEHYGATCDLLVDSGAAYDRRMVYWDVRPSAHLPTVEVRVADVAATADEAVLLAGLVRGLVTAALADVARGLAAPRVPTELLRVASWRAARDGVAGLCLDVPSERLVPARLVLDRLVHRVRDHLDADDLAVVRDGLAELDRHGGGAARQRSAHARAGRLSDVLDQVAADTVAGAETWAVAGQAGLSSTRAE